MLRLNLIIIALFCSPVLCTYLPIKEIKSFLHLSGNLLNGLTGSGFTKHDESLKITLENLLKIQKHHPEFVMWSSAGEHHLNRMVIELKQAFKKTPVLPALPPTIAVSGNLYKSMSNYFGDWLDITSQETFKKGGYYSKAIGKLKGLQIIVLNTALFCHFHPLSVLDDPADQWNWLASELNIARIENKTVYLLMSVIPGLSREYHDKSFTPKHNERFINITHNYSDIIKGQFGGHDDAKKHYTILADNKGKAYGWAIVTPPFYRSAREYVYRSQTYSIMDYIQYSRKKYDWRIQYQLTEHYPVSNLTAAVFEILVSHLNSTISNRFLEFVSSVASGVGDLAGSAYEGAKYAGKGVLNFIGLGGGEDEEEPYVTAENSKELKEVLGFDETEGDSLEELVWSCNSTVVKCIRCCMCKELAENLHRYVSCVTENGNLLLSGKAKSEANLPLIANLVCIVILYYTHCL